jgi:hypothetical protein
MRRVVHSWRHDAYSLNKTGWFFSIAFWLGLVPIFLEQTAVRFPHPVNIVFADKVSDLHGERSK